MNGRRYAYGAVGVGLTVSIWANVAHAMTAPGGAEPGAVAMAAFWPLGLFLALEVLTRTSWSAGRGLVAARLGVGVVALVAAVVSYLHLHALLLHYGEGLVPALLGPLAIDGLMTTGAAALLTGTTEPVTAPIVAQPVPSLTAPEEESQPTATAPAIERVKVTPPAPRGRATGRRAAQTPGRVTDDALVSRVMEAVEDGQISPDDVTGNRLRGLLGVGAERAGRIAEAWQAQHHAGAVRHLHTAAVGD